jgi:hypothetical protein
MYQLRCNANPDFASVDSFWSWVNELTRFTLLLALGCILGKDKVLKAVLLAFEMMSRIQEISPRDHPKTQPP